MCAETSEPFGKTGGRAKKEVGGTASTCSRGELVAATGDGKEICMNTLVEKAQSRDSHHGPDHEGCRTVEIHVNNKPVVLQPGPYDVSTFKKIAGVPLADDLDELVNCKLKPISDNATIHIEGCEVFISHVKDGGAS